jgi:hypothetical protein
LHQAATIFRLERYSVPAPRLLAVGQQYVSAGRMASFLLTESPARLVSLKNWCDQESDVRRRFRVAERAAETLRTIHDAECVLGDSAELMLRDATHGVPEVGVDSAAGMRPSRRARRADRERDLRRLYEEFAPRCRRGELLRFLLHYRDAAARTDRGRLRHKAGGPKSPPCAEGGHGPSVGGHQGRRRLLPPVMSLIAGLFTTGNKFYPSLSRSHGR